MINEKPVLKPEDGKTRKSWAITSDDNPEPMNYNAE
jgi:hypothetical protein